MAEWRRFGSGTHYKGLEQIRMLLPFPETGKIEVPSEWAHKLLKAAESLPLYDNKEFYSPALQLDVLNRIREACSDGFDWLIGR